MKHSSSAIASSLTPLASAYAVPDLGLVRVTGQDAIKVLGGLCTAKLTDLSVGTATEAFFTDDRGRVLAHAIVARDAAGAWIVGQLPAPDALAAHIDRFIFREDASPRNVTSAWVGRLADGAEAIARLAAAAGSPEAAVREAGIVQLRIGPLELTIVRMPITGPDARLCLVPAEQSAALDQALATAGFAAPSDPAEFESRRIVNFWPVAGREIAERTLPQELDRDARAISFTKGCYLGQETVARLDALGEVQKKLCLVRLSCDGEFAAGESLSSDGKEVGKLTSIAPLASDHARWALATMRRGFFAAGSEFLCRDIPGIVVEHA